MAKKKTKPVKKPAPKKRERKPLTDIQKQAHAWAQAAYKLRQKLQAAPAGEKSKVFNTLNTLQADREIFNRANGIKKRTPTQVKKAREIGKGKEGLITEYDFRNTKSAKQQLTEYLKSPFLQRLNGNKINPLIALSALDNLILSMDSYETLFLIFDELTGDLYAYTENINEDSEDGDE